MRRSTLAFLLVLPAIPALAGVVGRGIGSGILHPQKKPLTAAHIAEADRAFAAVGAAREDFTVPAPDGALLQGWKVRSRQPNGDWVLLFHGVADNRIGVLGHAELFLRAGYSVVMMDARAHGESEGAMATYGWLERSDTRAVVDALEAAEKVRHLFALGESLGAAIALQSAAADSRIEAVVAEASFANLREVSFDYAGLGISHWLGRTLFRPAALTAIHSAEREGGFRFDDVSPERAVAARPFAVFLICGESDRRIPCRHAKRIFKSAMGPKSLWRVPGAGHSEALGRAPDEFGRRVLEFFREAALGE